MQRCPARRHGGEGQQRSSKSFCPGGLRAEHLRWACPCRSDGARMHHPRAGSARPVWGAISAVTMSECRTHMWDVAWAAGPHEPRPQ
eukprot:1151268-Pelagomonas_calceolata.AAC.10